MIKFELPENNNSIIKVIGVGGGGGNAVNYMYSLGLDGVNFIVCNTDMKALNNSPIPTKIQLGPLLTEGLGAGANPQIGEAATQESIEELKNLLSNNTKMVFVTAGMGGGTGTGGAPIVAKLAKEMGILTVGIVTTPFSYEGKKRKKNAEDGIAELRKNVDTILVVSNDKLRHQFGNIATSEAFSKADDILATATKCITDVISSQGHIVVDFADVCTVMRDGGAAILGSGKAKGEKRAFEAVEKALNSPLLNDNNIKSAKWVLLNINSSRGEHEHTLDEVEMIQAYVQDQAGDDCDLIFGTGFDDNLNDEISVTVIATGFDANRTEEAYNANSSEALASLNPKIIFNLVEEKPAEIVEQNSSINENNIENKIIVENSIETNSYSYEPQLIELEAPAIPNVLAFGAMRNTIQNAMAENKNVIAVNEKIEIIDLANDMNVNFIVDTPQVENNIVAEINEVKENNIELEITNAFSNTDISKNNINEVLTDIATAWKNEETPTANFDIELKVKETNEIVEDEIVTIKGITLNRRKGNRILSDYELEQEANFEIQKRSFDERASKLRSLSFNFDTNENKSEDEEIPAYIRRQQFLENHSDSSEEHLSDVNVLANKNATNSNVSTVNSFLNGKNPD